jgi:xanthine dehydrogenase small subunit
MTNVRANEVLSASTEQATRSKIRFLMDGRVCEHDNIEPTTTVLEYLRNVAGKKSTKEGCAEGDCGACTIAIGELVDGQIRYRAVNSCIQFLPTIDGKHLLTAEDLANGKDLHPAQATLVKSDGSQCGFCTPGFVMSMFTLLTDSEAPDISDIEDALAGNLCRCTGYGPIISATMEASRGMAAYVPPASIQPKAEDLQNLSDGRQLCVETPGRRFRSPRSLAQLISCLEDNPKATLVAGTTDVGLWVTKRHLQLTDLIYLGEVAELKSISDEGDWLSIGAAVTYTDAQQFLGRHYRDLGELIRRIGSRQVRNLATIGGNIANGSPIGDGPPALIALDARLVLNGVDGRREIPLEDFFIAYGKQDRRPGEFVESVILPKPSKNQHFAAYKISKRFDQDISAACGAFSAMLENGIASNVRICFGGMAATPKRARACEAVLTGRPWTLETIDAAAAAMAEDYTPLTDMRASAAYRLQVAGNLLRKFFIETTQPDVSTRIVEMGRQLSYG